MQCVEQLIHTLSEVKGKTELWHMQFPLTALDTVCYVYMCMGVTPPPPLTGTNRHSTIQRNAAGWCLLVGVRSPTIEPHSASDLL